MNDQSRTVGDVISIDLRDGWIAFARVLPEPLVAFYGCRANRILPLDEVVSSGVLWKLWVMNHAISSGRWPVIGHVPLEESLNHEPIFFKQDPISRGFSFYQGTEEWPVRREECEGLERAAVWNPEHVEDRLRDHFEGRPNKWVESLRAR